MSCWKAWFQLETWSKFTLTPLKYKNRLWRGRRSSAGPRGAHLVPGDDDAAQPPGQGGAHSRDLGPTLQRSQFHQHQKWSAALLNKFYFFLVADLKFRLVLANHQRPNSSEEGHGMGQDGGSTQLRSQAPHERFRVGGQSWPWHVIH